MSGRYAFRNGSTNQDACMRMNPSELVLPKMFKSAGYVSAMIGKYGQLPGEPDETVFSVLFNQLAGMWYVRDDQ